MKNAIPETSEKPDISFESPNDNRFPSPHEFEETMIKRSHLYSEKPKLTVGQIIIGSLALAGICAVLFFNFRYFFSMTPDPELMERYNDSIAVKLTMLFNSLSADVASGETGRVFGSLGIWAGTAAIGLLAGSADLLLSRIPPDNAISARFGFSTSPVLRFLPSVLTAVYLLFRYITEKFIGDLHFSVTTSNFSLKGEGYTWEMWVTQAFYLLFLLSCVFMLYETFANSGVFGMLIRIPLTIMCNTAVVVMLLLGSSCVIVITLMFIMIKAIGIIIGITLPDKVKYYRE